MTARALSRVKLLALFAVFAVPLGIAAVVYMDPGKYDPGTTNRGDLIEPVRPMETALLLQANGDGLQRDFFMRRWTLLFWNGAQCDLYCEASLFKIRQARLILGRHAARVKTVYLSAPGAGAGGGLSRLQKFHPALQLVRLDRGAAVMSGLAAGRIYVVDPLGNLMMSYPRDAATRDIVTDMKWLLKVSKIG